DPLPAFVRTYAGDGDKPFTTAQPEGLDGPAPFRNDREGSKRAHRARPTPPGRGRLGGVRSSCASVLQELADNGSDRTCDGASDGGDGESNAPRGFGRRLRHVPPRSS